MDQELVRISIADSNRLTGIPRVAWEMSEQLQGLRGGTTEGFQGCVAR